MASGFFALFDDIATIMDDVATMGKVATKKTAGLLGDDLAVNAEQATGFVSSRELPVIWAITKGSFLNKFIILPLIVLLSLYAPKAIVPILLIGGLYLAYEGAEKIYEYFFPHKAHEEKQIETLQALTKEDIIIREKEKIKSAIITDFILSLEIVIITLSTVKEQPLNIQLPVLIIIAILTTIGVYGIVALIVRLDDMGYKLIAKGRENDNKSLKRIGITLVKSLPVIIKALAVIGTLAMLLVAGGIYVHNIHQIHNWLHAIPGVLAEFLVGLILSIIVFTMIQTIIWIKNKITS